MAEIKGNADKLATSSLVNYTVIEIIHHEMGNGLAAISGYTKLLVRSMHSQEKEFSQHNVEMASRYNEKSLVYLRIIQDSEEYLNNFLAQLRDSSINDVKSSFSRCTVKTNLVSLVKHIIEKLIPLYKEHALQTHYPVHPLYVQCNPLWMDFALEHILNHNIAAHQASIPIVIEAEEYNDPSNDRHEARIAIQIKRSAKERTNHKDIFSAWSQTLDEKDRDMCIALCTGIFCEHGGRIWKGLETDQKEVLYATLPLVK